MAALIAEAYSTASQAASALHAMAILQVHQVKALKQMYKGSSDPRLMQELRLADFALRVTKVMLQSLGRRSPLWWSKSTISGSTWKRLRMLTKYAFSKLPSPRLGCSATLLGLFPADWGDPAHLAPTWCTTSHRCPTGQASVCSSPGASSYIPQSCEMWESALSQETMRTVSLISPEEGQADNLLLCLVLLV